jgi:hypothetical protein
MEILTELAMSMKIATVLATAIVSGFRPLHRLFFDIGFP